MGQLLLDRSDQARLLVDRVDVSVWEKGSGIFRLENDGANSGEFKRVQASSDCS